MVLAEFDTALVLRKEKAKDMLLRILGTVSRIGDEILEPQLEKSLANKTARTLESVVVTVLKKSVVVVVAIFRVRADKDTFVSTALKF